MIASHFGSVVLLQQQQLGRCGLSFVPLLDSILQSFIKGATLDIDNLSIQKEFYSIVAAFVYFEGSDQDVLVVITTSFVLVI